MVNFAILLESVRANVPRCYREGMSTPRQPKRIESERTAARRRVGAMSTHTIERTCAHNLIESECAYCAFPALVIESESARTARAAARLAASMRRAMLDRERERDLMRGYALITRSMLDAIESAARAAARPYGGDDADIFERARDAFAVWLARQDRPIIESVRGDLSHVRSLARRIAVRMARGAGTGRGHMPRLRIGEHASECERGVCVTYCGAVIVENALRGLVVRVTAADGIAHDRPLTASERTAVTDTLDYERVPGTPDYPRWLDAFGESAPNVGAAHPFGHRAPGVPERDAASVRRASMIESARALGLNWALVDAALSNVRRTRRGFAVDTRALAAATRDTRHVSNVRRELAAVLDVLAIIDRDDIALPIPAPRGHLWHAVSRHECESTCEHGAPIIESTYRGGTQLRADGRTIYPREHEHERVRIERADSGDLIESTYTYTASECSYCQQWNARTAATAHAWVLHRESMSESA